MQEVLKFTIEDREIAQLFGRQNFSSELSAVLEIIKNSYDAGAFNVSINIKKDYLEIIDDGLGMTKDTIKTKWMVVGKSDKGYSFLDKKGNTRVLSGSKGVGRFALARLGNKIEVITKTDKSSPCVWRTDWSTSTVDDYISESISCGTIIKISETNDYWNKKKADDLQKYLSICKNFDQMNIKVSFDEESANCENPFKLLKIGENYLSSINIVFDSKSLTLKVKIDSDEFDEKANNYIKEKDKLDIYSYEKVLPVNSEKIADSYSTEVLAGVGDFEARFYYFNRVNDVDDYERFLYKNRQYKMSGFVSPIDGVTLYRNSFSIANYEKGNDWLGLSKRSIKSPAAATHLTGRWRVRLNQICGSVFIDKTKNKNIKEIQNRQGIETDDYFDCFKDIILLGIDIFEEYRQTIIRLIDKKNKAFEPRKRSVSIIDKFLRNPRKDYDTEKRVILANAIDNERQSFKSKEYQYTKRIAEHDYALSLLNSLATLGLKSSLFAHKIDNRRNIINGFYDNTIRILKSEGIWEPLTVKNYDSLSDSLPYQLEIIKKAHNDVLNFVDTSLDSVKSEYIRTEVISIKDAVSNVLDDWKILYEERCPRFVVRGDDVSVSLPYNAIKTVFDNLVLNSLQQNDRKEDLSIEIEYFKEDDGVRIIYKDNGVGLNQKYKENPMKIMQPFETSRGNDGHGLGMWIIDNFINLTKGKVEKIGTDQGFYFEFILNNMSENK